MEGSRKTDLFRFVKFGAVGVMNTAVDFSIYFLLTRAFLFHYLSAHVIAFIVATVNSYVFNKYWTFQEKSRRSVSQYSLFLVFQALGLALSAAIIHISIKYFSIQDIYAKLIASGVVMIWNYFMSKKIVFVNIKKEEEILNY